MLNYVQLSVFALFWLIIHSQNCQKSYDFDYSSCVFYFDQNQSCQAFGFASCEWQACSEFYCASSVIQKSTSWTQCTNMCCDGAVTYSERWESVQKCQDFTNSQHNKIYMIVGLVFVGIGVLVFVMLCIFCCSSIGVNRCFDGITVCVCFIMTCKCLRKAPEIDNNQRNQVHPAISSQEEINESFGKNGQLFVWISMEFQSSKIAQNCSICYQMQPTIELQCGHIFHQQCITEWVKRKPNCPECRLPKINNINVYCKECFSSYKRSRIFDQNRPGYIRQDICKKCNESKEN